jgi:hypothetical protein
MIGPRGAVVGGGTGDEPGAPTVRTAGTVGAPTVRSRSRNARQAQRPLVSNR